MNLEVFSSSNQLARDAARRVVASAKSAIGTHGAFHFALAGGSTPKAVFRYLAESGIFTPDLVEKTHLYWGDERAVPNDHPDSNVRMARETMIDHLKFPAENVHLVNGGAPNLASEAWRVEKDIRLNVFSLGDLVPIFDMVMLGMGTDGHTASLFPDTEALKEESRLFVANDVPQLGTKRLTLTYKAINAARDILILVSGTAKADVLADIRSVPNRMINKYPIEGISKHAIWLADEDAATQAKAAS